MENIQAHIAKVFSKWISHSAHFVATLLPLAEGWSRATAALASPQISNRPAGSAGAPPETTQTGLMDNGVSPSLRVLSSHLQGRPPKQHLSRGGGGNLPPSSPERDGADSDGYSTISETPRSHCRNRRRHNEKHLAPAHLDMPIFKLTDPNLHLHFVEV